MSTEYELKRHLRKIIARAYGDDPKIREYRTFELHLRDENLSGSTGTYDPRIKTIEITNLGDKEANNLCTLIHELSHHIETCQRGKTGHQKEFYAIYAKLLYAALDLGSISLSDFQQMDHRNTDYGKVQKILKQYVPSAVISEEKKTVSVVHAYAIRDELKKHGYHWDDLNKSWVRTLSVHEAEAEYRRLLSDGVDRDTVQILDASAMRMAKGGHALRVFGAFDIKEQLKERGYHWDKERKCWYKQIPKEQADTETKEIAKLGTFQIEYS